MLNSIKNHIRLCVQIVFTAITNGYFYGFATGRIYTGRSKTVCVPGLNCYSCPGALGSCPIGSLQAVLANRNYKFSFYVVGFLILFGSIFGRFICGWLCPFGLIQDLLYKIPFFRKHKNLPGHKALIWLKYIILAVFVIILPLFVLDIIGQGSPWFCKYICPSGTLTAGLPLLAANEPLRQATGFLFQWKLLILIVLILLSVAFYRPFCKYICPLGAVYSVFNPIALYRYQIDTKRCIDCGKCKSACKMDIDVCKNPNSPECIRCGDCIRSCPVNAIGRLHR
ncbi:4Fe-4S binding protein [Mediterraneibacter agrestimuris]|uniref:4Fe-4S binding protein n=1 Tax=Mediterraneibacter agrestimuris TaxID=2941333 RepID=UPI002041D44E|nr:4Fe-4S binding protein [Mediterraneibacter agrestimuris]